MNAEEALIEAEAARLRFDPWKLRLWREAKGMTCQNVADACGLSGRAALEVSRWETYRTPVGRNVLGRIAHAMGIPESSFLSNRAEWDANLAKYERWVKDKRPKLAAWLERNK